MRKLLRVSACLLLVGCTSELAKIDDAKCLSYGAKRGDQAYVACRAQLDVARTQASASGPGMAPANIPTMDAPHISQAPMVWRP